MKTDRVQGKSRKGTAGSKMSKVAEGSRRILKLRKGRKETQIEFAKAVEVGQPQVSAWELGTDSPSIGAWVRMAKLASYPENLWFLEQAGIDARALRPITAGIQKDDAMISRPFWETGAVVPIRRFRATEQGREEAGAPVPLPKEFVPNPQATICLSVDEESTTMVDAPRGLFILDLSIEGIDDLSTMWGRVVILRHPGVGETFLRWPAGLYAGRLMMKWAPRSMSAGDIIFEAGLAMLGREGGHYSLPLGSYAFPSAMKPIPGPEESAARIAEAEKIARSKFRLDKSVRILGRVIGRMTGHIE